MKRIRILVIDDNPGVGRTIKGILEYTGKYQVSVELEARAGLLRAGEAMPALILLDLEMPGVDGMEMLQELKRSDLTRSIPVIVLTGHTEEELVGREGFDHDAEHLLKPMTSSKLQETVERVLIARRADP